MARAKKSRVMDIDPEELSSDGSTSDDKPDAEQEEGNQEAEPE